MAEPATSALTWFPEGQRFGQFTVGVARRQGRRPLVERTDRGETSATRGEDTGVLRGIWEDWASGVRGAHGGDSLDDDFGEYDDG